MFSVHLARCLSQKSLYDAMDRAFGFYLVDHGIIHISQNFVIKLPGPCQTLQYHFYNKEDLLIE